jgi:hypothetical protein
MQNANNIKFRASSMWKIMKNSRDKKQLGETCITHLVDLFVQEKYGRREFITSKYLSKGNEREEQSIALLSFLTQVSYEKNTVRLENGHSQGEPDLFNGESIYKAKRTLYIKSSWSVHTFFRTKQKPVDEEYYFQGQTYMDLTGADYHSVVFCLVNGTLKAIMDEKRIAAYQYGVLDPTQTTNEEYKERCRQIEINHIVDLDSFQEEYPHYDLDNDLSQWKYTIPYEDRLFQFHFERNQEDIDRMHERVIKCREWMNKNLFKIGDKDYKEMIKKGNALRELLKNRI